MIRLLLLIVPWTAFAQVRTRVVLPGAAGQAAGGAGAALDSASAVGGVSIVPKLTPALDLSLPSTQAEPTLAPVAQAVGPQLSPALLPAAKVPSSMPALRTPAVKPDEKQRTLPSVKALGDREKAASPVERSGEERAMEGRVLFDQSAEQAPAVSARLPDIVPEYPGKPGDLVRINGNEYVLDRKLGEGTPSTVYKVKGRPWVVKLVYPGFHGVPNWWGEVEPLRKMERFGIPHARLLDHSEDQLVLVKELMRGRTIYDVTEKRRLSKKQKEALLDIAARIIEVGYTADLNMGNLMWRPSTDEWVLVDGGGFQEGPPWGVLGQLFPDDRIARTGVDPVEFLRGLRDRLGHRSRAWRRVLREVRSPRDKGYLERTRR